MQQDGGEPAQLTYTPAHPQICVVQGFALPGTYGVVHTLSPAHPQGGRRRVTSPHSTGVLSPSDRQSPLLSTILHSVQHMQGQVQQMHVELSQAQKYESHPRVAAIGPRLCSRPPTLPSQRRVRDEEAQERTGETLNHMRDEMAVRARQTELVNSLRFEELNAGLRGANAGIKEVHDTLSAYVLTADMKLRVIEAMCILTMNEPGKQELAECLGKVSQIEETEPGKTLQVADVLPSRASTRARAHTHARARTTSYAVRRRRRRRRSNVPCGDSCSRRPTHRSRARQPR